MDEHTLSKYVTVSTHSVLREPPRVSCQFAQDAPRPIWLGYPSVTPLSGSGTCMSTWRHFYELGRGSEKSQRLRLRVLQSPLLNLISLRRGRGGVRGRVSEINRSTGVPPWMRGVMVVEGRQKRAVEIGGGSERSRHETLAFSAFMSRLDRVLRRSGAKTHDNRQIGDRWVCGRFAELIHALRSGRATRSRICRTLVRESVTRSLIIGVNDTRYQQNGNRVKP